ncbi:DNA repair protein RAD50 [Lampetra fluviatilis]
MAKIDKMSILGVRSFGVSDCDKQVITFHTPLTILVGHNGAGKTTIIECLKYICTGDFPPGTSGASFIHDPKVAHETDVKAQIRLQFMDVNGDMVTVQRLLHATQKAKKVEFKTLEGVFTRLKNGEKYSISSKCTDMNREMITALGVSKAVLSNVIFCHQEDSNWPLSEGKALKQKFDEIFSATRYIKALDSLSKVRKDQGSIVRELQAVVKLLQQNKNKAEELQRDLDDIVTKLEASRESVFTIDREVSPLEINLKDVESKLAVVVRLDNEVKATQSRQAQMEVDSRDLQEKMEQVFQGTDEQLQEAYSSHQRRVQEKERRLGERQRELERVNREVLRLRNVKGGLHVEQGKLQQEAERHASTVKRRDQLVQTLASELELDGYSSVPLSDRQVSSFTRLVRERMEQDDNNVKRLLHEFEEKENEKQRQMDDARERKTAAESSVQLKRELLGDKQAELEEKRAELGRLQSSGDRLQVVESELRDTEHQLEVAEGSSQAEGLRTELQRMQRERTDFDSLLRRLDHEMSTLNLHTQARTQLDMHNKEKVEKEEQIRRIRLRHDKTLVTFVGHFPSKGELEMWLDRRAQERRQLQAKIQGLNKLLASAEQNKSHLTTELRRKEERLKENEEQLFELCGGRDLESELLALQDQIERTNKQRAMLAGASAVYTQFISQLTEESGPDDLEGMGAAAGCGGGGGGGAGQGSPCCPVCQRAFQSESDLAEVVNDLQAKLRLVPDKLRATETELTRKQKRRDNMIQLKPMQQRVVETSEKELPELRNRLSSLNQEIQRLKNSLDEEETLQATLESEEDAVKSCQQDVALMDRFQSDLRELERKVAQQMARLAGVDVERTLQVVGDEKQDVQRKLDNVNNALELKRLALETDMERINELRSRVNSVREERLRLATGMQRIEALRSLTAELEAETSDLKRQIQEAQEQVLPLEGTLRKLQLEKAEIVARKTREHNHAARRISDLQDKNKNIIAFMKEVDTYINSGRDQLKKNKELEMQEVARELSGEEENQVQIGRDISGIRQEIDTQKVRERCLQDNLTLRRRQQELASVGDSITRLLEKMGSMNVMQLKTEQERLISHLEELKSKRSRALGRQQGLQDTKYKFEGQLKDKQFRDAAKEYMDNIIVMKTSELACKDLDVYYKALDQAIMKFHSMKMQEINKIIRDLWRNTYRSQDIEYIEIRSDADESASASDKRRNYNYRVVMVKGDTPLDMRGRCSAGQKVLASLIIRLALAETFCLNCGILALDEPTTNLDRENIESLAHALVEIIKSRSRQRNFQLLVITHDEDFVELLGRSEYVDHFYRVRKNNEQCSEIVKCSVSTLQASVA